MTRPRNIRDFLHEQSPSLSVGILSADLMRLQDEISLLQENGVPCIHFDVMDGVFVPSLTVGPPFIKGVKTPLLKDVHLMVQDPLDKVEEYVKAGADMLTVHLEATKNVLPVLKKLGQLENQNDPSRGLLRGLAILPPTPIAALEPLLGHVEMIVVLAVNPQVKGMPFDPLFPEKYQQIRELIAAANTGTLLAIDGGVKRANITRLSRLGADLIVSGSAIFDGKNPGDNLRFFMQTTKNKGKDDEKSMV